MDKHNGTIHLESDVGQGTRFFLTFKTPQPGWRYGLTNAWDLRTGEP